MEKKHYACKGTYMIYTGRKFGSKKNIFIEDNDIGPENCFKRQYGRENFRMIFKTGYKNLKLLKILVNDAAFICLILF